MAIIQQMLRYLSLDHHAPYLHILEGKTTAVRVCFNSVFAKNILNLSKSQAKSLLLHSKLTINSKLNYLCYGDLSYVPKRKASPHNVTVQTD